MWSLNISKNALCNRNELLLFWGEWGPYDHLSFTSVMDQKANYANAISFENWSKSVYFCWWGDFKSDSRKTAKKCIKTYHVVDEKTVSTAGPLSWKTPMRKIFLSRPRLASMVLFKTLDLVSSNFQMRKFAANVIIMTVESNSSKWVVLEMLYDDIGILYLRYLSRWWMSSYRRIPRSSLSVTNVEGSSWREFWMDGSKTYINYFQELCGRHIQCVNILFFDFAQ